MNKRLSMIAWTNMYCSFCCCQYDLCSRASNYFLYFLLVLGLLGTLLFGALYLLFKKKRLSTSVYVGIISRELDHQLFADVAKCFDSRFFCMSTAVNSVGVNNNAILNAIALANLSFSPMSEYNIGHAAAAAKG